MALFKRYILLLSIATLSSLAMGQTLQQGRNLFSQGRYLEAKPIMLKYLKQKPSDASRNYWYGVCLYETGHPDEALQYLNKASSKIIKAYRYIGHYYENRELYNEAIENYQLFVSGMQTDSELHDIQLEENYIHRVDSLRTLFRMIRNTNKVCFIDSFIVAKDELFNSYITDASTGSFALYSDIINGQEDGEVYIPEIDNNIVFSRYDGDRYRLYQRFRNDDRWVDEEPLVGLESDGNIRYPFIQNDGITIYFASDGSESIGGYDIFVSRFNPSTNRYLHAENIGMPFNSTANDYLYVIDEINNLGWFATDRNQPDDTVCIYVFIPDAQRGKYNYEDGDTVAIHNAARLKSIKDTQTDLDAVRKARQRLTLLAYDKEETIRNSGNTFIIDDYTEYHSEAEFECGEAQRLYIKWIDELNSFNKKKAELENMRLEYYRADKNGKESMRNRLINLEKELFKSETDIKNMERDIRNKEIEFLNR